MSVIDLLRALVLRKPFHKMDRFHGYLDFLAPCGCFRFAFFLVSVIVIPSFLVSRSQASISPIIACF